MTLSNISITGRRRLIKTAAGLALLQVLMSRAESSAIANNKGKGSGKKGDFDFLTGEWTIENRRLKTPNTNDWDEFGGEATIFGFLDGIGSLEELRIPARNFAGMGLRLLDIDNGVWNDYWVNAKNPVLSVPGLQGQFENGVGSFTAEEESDGKKSIVRGVWDQITPNSCRWFQSSSTDGGKTWLDNWIMQWRRKI